MTASPSEAVSRALGWGCWLRPPPKQLWATWSSCPGPADRSQDPMGRRWRPQSPAEAAARLLGCRRGVDAAPPSPSPSPPPPPPAPSRLGPSASRFPGGSPPAGSPAPGSVSAPPPRQAATPSSRAPETRVAGRPAETTAAGGTERAAAGRLRLVSAVPTRPSR